MLGCKRVVLVALVAIMLSAFSNVQAAADEKDCEVCVKVVDDVKGVYATLLEQKKGGKKLEIAESALGKYCSKKLSTKDNKLVNIVGVAVEERPCYFLEPLKKDVARQITYSKESFKICKLLEKKNPDFCSMRYPTKTDVNTDYTKLRVKQLKKILSERNVECVGCVEKADFIKKIKETESQHSEL